MKQLWYGGTIYTMEEENETVEAVLVEDGKISATGSFADLSLLADEKINLEGTTMYPGFVDSHLHLLFLGIQLTRLDLSEARSAEEMLEMVRKAAENTPKDQWLFGEGWNENNFINPRIPTIDELDKIRKEPILLTRVCHHAVLGNSAALQVGAVTDQTKSPAGGEIGHDENGNLNGLLFEQAMNLITDRLPKEGDAYVQFLTDALNLSINHLLSYGLTGGHTEDMHYFGHYTNPLTAYHRVVGDKNHFRIHMLRHDGVFEEMMKANVPCNNPFIEAGAMKIFVDGALGSSTAALSAPYTDEPNNNGLLIHTNEQLKNVVKLARTYDEAVAIHVIGDAGVEQALDVIEEYPVQEGKRDRLIHCCVLREDLINRMAKLPIVVDIQPAFVPSDFPWVIDRLGKDRLAFSYPWNTLVDSGIVCAIGTDAPIESINPLETIYAATERKKPFDEGDGYLPEQKLSRFDAIQMYTVGSAKAICKEHERGLIKQGYDADFSIFDRDLFIGKPESMLKAKAVKTVVAGRTVFNYDKNNKHKE